MRDFVIKELCLSDIESELSEIGFDSSYVATASEKYKYKNIKVYDLTPAQANIIKQTALSVGADCATHREVITGNIEKSNIILGGSISELKKIAEKLKYQPFSLNKLAENIETALTAQKRITRLCGILNVTPDSFSDGGMYYNSKDAIERFYQMIDDGAEMIDIGAESTGPGANTVPDEEQIRRLKPILSEVKNNKIPISIDTRSSVVAKYALEQGVRIINDVSGFDFDSNMINILAQYSAGVIIQHSKDKATYNNVVDEVYLNLLNKIELAKSGGINDIIIDPGICFGKTKEQNYELLDRIDEFFGLKHPIMIGVSRKSFLGFRKQDDNNLKDIFTTAVSYPLIKKRVDYLRVHNVKLHKQLLSLVN